MTTDAMVALLWVAVLANLLLTLRLIGRLRFLLDPYRNPPRIPTPPVGQAAPAFVGQTIDGQPLRLAEFADRSLTLVYMSYKCPSCGSYLPTLNDVRALAINAGGELALVVFDEDSTAGTVTRQMVRQLGLTTPVLLINSEHALQKVYNSLQASPYFIHIERGIVRATGGIGQAEWDGLTQRWRSALPAATVPAPVAP